MIDRHQANLVPRDAVGQFESYLVKKNSEIIHSEQNLEETF